MQETFPAQWQYIRIILYLAGLLLFLFIESHISYRKPTVSKLRRDVVNLCLTVMNGFFIYIFFSAMIMTAVSYTAEHKAGILNLFNIPVFINIIATVIFMDFMLYIWHLLNHKIPFLWKFHQVHHSDINMDTTTATRFHIGELAISIVIRISLIYFIGAGIAGLIIFECLLSMCAQFHHSSITTTKAFDEWFRRCFVSPSMHRIHHSVKKSERDSNYGTIFSIWDRILGTLKTEVSQSGIKIGLFAYQDSRHNTLASLMCMPFTKNEK